MEKSRPALQDLGKQAKILVFGTSKPMEFDSLKDLIGIVTAKKPIDVEELLDLRGFDDVGDDLEF
jgi:hypothetical protein